MTRVPVTRDPQFPHGQRTGYYRGCRCEACSKAARRTRKANRVYQYTGEPHPNRRVDAAPARDHLSRLMAEVPGASYASMAAAAGVSKRTVCNILHSKYPSLRLPVSERCLSITAADVARETAMVPADVSIRRCRVMQATGYSLAWQAKEMGSTSGSHQPPRFVASNADRITKDLADRVTALWNRVGLSEATPENTGLPRSAISHAKSQAAARGYQPRIYCDDDAVFDPRSVPGHPWSNTDDRCARKLDFLEAILDKPAGESLTALAARLRADLGAAVKDMDQESIERELDRVKAAAKITARDPERDANIARARRILRAWQDGDEDVVAAALDLGLYEPTVISRKHPGRIEWERHRAAAATREAEAA